MVLSDEIFAYITIYMTIPLAYSLALFFDSITREQHESLKLCIITFLAALKIVFSMEGDALTRTVQDGVVYWNMSFNLSLAGGALTIFMIASYVFYMGKIFANCPHDLRNRSLLGLVGSFVMAIEPFSTFFNTGFPLPIFLTIGTILTILSFISVPQLAFILPFKASALFIFNSQSGIPLYSYYWDKRIVTDTITLLPPMLQGISGALVECVNKGPLQGVYLDNAQILLKRTRSFVCAIITTKKSPSIIHALNAFSEAFGLKYDSQSWSANLDKFEGTEELVEKYFDFVPKYK